MAILVPGWVNVGTEYYSTKVVAEDYVNIGTDVGVDATSHKAPGKTPLLGGSTSLLKELGMLDKITVRLDSGKTRLISCSIDKISTAVHNIVGKTVGAGASGGKIVSARIARRRHLG